jgi:hypothetical protein
MKRLIAICLLLTSLYAQSQELYQLKVSLSPTLGEGTFFSIIRPTFLKDEALLIRTYPTQKAFLKLEEKTLNRQNKNEYSIIYEGKPKAKEMLIHYDQKEASYQLFYHYNDRLLRNTNYPKEYIRFSKSSLGFILSMFQPLVVDNPLLLVGIKYLQKRHINIVDIQKKYTDIHGNPVVSDDLGHIKTSLSMRRLQKSPLQERYYLLTKEEGKSYHYYATKEGLEKMVLQTNHQTKERLIHKDFIPKRTMLQLLNQPKKVEKLSVPTL